MPAAVLYGALYLLFYTLTPTAYRAALSQMAGRLLVTAMVGSGAPRCRGCCAPVFHL
jgi:hypothetical protein